MLKDGESSCEISCTYKSYIKERYFVSSYLAENLITHIHTCKEISTILFYISKHLNLVAKVQ